VAVFYFGNDIYRMSAFGPKRTSRPLRKELKGTLEEEGPRTDEKHKCGRAK